LLLLAAVSLGAGAALAQECKEGECCIKKECCFAKQFLPCGRNETCTCTFVCGPTQAKCECECKGPERQVEIWPRNAPADLGAAVPLDTAAGVTISNGTRPLWGLALTLEKMSGWTVRVSPGVANLRGSGSWEGTLEEVIRGIADSYGVFAHIDELTGSIAFLEP
jgi:hypothetical protein